MKPGVLGAGLLALVIGVAAVAQAPRTISSAELIDQINSDAPPVILDVRTRAEFDAGHIPGAVNIPHDELAARLAELSNDRAAPIVVYCRTGRRAALAEALLVEAGYSAVIDLDGHWRSWPGIPAAQDPVTAH